MRRLSGFLFTPIAASPSAHAEGAAIRGSASISKAIFDLPSPVPLSQAAKLQAVPPLFFVRRRSQPSLHQAALTLCNLNIIQSAAEGAHDRAG